jgi:ribonuclease D
MKQKIHFHRGDLPADVSFPNGVAVDTETMGLQLHRDPLCIVQLSGGDGVCHVVQLDRKTYDAPNLKRLFSDADTLKIFHFARFDVAAIWQYLNVECAPIYCTKIASKLCRTYTNRHSLKDLCKVLINVELSKEEQLSDWGTEELSESQQKYAATDVLYLHQLKESLDILLLREGRDELAQACFDFIPTRCKLDLLGFDSFPDVFAHS